MLRDKQPDTRYETQIRSVLQEGDTQRMQMVGWKRALGLRKRDHCVEHLLNVELLLLMRCYLGKCNLKTEKRINQVLQAFVTLQENSLPRKSESQWRQEDNGWKSEKIRNPAISSAEDDHIGLRNSKGQKYRATKERMYSIMKETGIENRWIT